MDFWSRLIAKKPSAPTDKFSSKNPENRLARFKKEYELLLSQTKLGTLYSLGGVEAAHQIRSSLLDLTTILSHESRQPLPHPCILYASSENIYLKIEEIAVLSHNEGIIRESVAIFATLIESEEEGFVENQNFSKSLMRLLTQITRAQIPNLGLDLEIEVVELSFNITTKIRLDPDVLPAWFMPQTRVEDPEAELDLQEKFTGKTNREDFPLLYLLIDYIRHEGRIGDFARTGLLYIIEAASNSIALEQWIIESDLATLMATGLGALYSQLSRKLVIDYPYEKLAPVLALSDYQHPVTSLEIVSSSSTEFQIQIKTFLSNLVFWQDVLNHCKSTEVKQTLLEHFQVIFLKQLLYPSLLESSDLDGGSSVAVLTYLRRILEALDHPDMIHLILHYLLALPDSGPSSSIFRASMSVARQRKSMDLATMLASKIETKQTPALYNLVDLIHGSLKSPNKETISVTLQLISVILKKHHRYAVATLFQTSQILSGRPLRSIGAHDGMMCFLLGLAEQVGGDRNLNEIYNECIVDCMNIIESHPCSIKMITPQLASASMKFSCSQVIVSGAPQEIRLHTLRTDDPILQMIIGMLATFLTNSVEINLSLTATIIDLATCGYMRIDGWLLPDPLKYLYRENDHKAESPSISKLYDDIEAEEELQLSFLRLARRMPELKKTPLPALLNELSKIIEQIIYYQKEIPRFDELLRQRREAFLTASVSVSTPFNRLQNEPRSVSDSNLESPGRFSAFDNFTQRIFPEKSTSGRSKSPRNYKSQEAPNKSSIGVRSMNSIGFRSVSTPLRSEMSKKMPFVENSHRYPSSQTKGAQSQFKQSGTSVNQTVTFAAEDQSIMARKVILKNLEKKKPRGKLQDLEEEKDQDSSDKDKEPDNNVDISENNVEGNTNDQNFVSVNHLLTNVIIIQDFLLELAALVQVRASLFGEVSYR
ncbi:hypothetical protein GcM3_027023 [Golovinomyces cichoracearum]|uniref:FHF complex subunit HOOK-interacting protein C-terminal domain-containing protein n=1 Tax=Golovinomyces cichoracearum TaxID=62708 RepID=A0A420J5Y8_9PEZI|nr:hypothetical protein GcM3_027023 [Golovinomyces cichoracearum]